MSGYGYPEPEEELASLKREFATYREAREKDLAEARVEGARAMLACAAGRLRAKFDPNDYIYRTFVMAAGEIEMMGDDATVNAAIREAKEGR